MGRGFHMKSFMNDELTQKEIDELLGQMLASVMSKAIEIAKRTKTHGCSHVPFSTLCLLLGNVTLYAFAEELFGKTCDGFKSCVH